MYHFLAVRLKLNGSDQKKHPGHFQKVNTFMFKIYSVQAIISVSHIVNLQYLNSSNEVKLKYMRETISSLMKGWTALVG